MSISAGYVWSQFQDHYGRTAEHLVRSPGRVNLIGEHTDYNDGFVLPMAMDRAVWLAAAHRDDHQVQVYSLDRRESATFSLTDLRRENAGWIEYIKGVATFLKNGGHRLHGFDAVLTGDIPIGAGLSSSAALEMAAARMLAALSGRAWDPVAGALLCQKAENEWVGVHCGIMDQLACGCGQAGHALRIDCRSLGIEHVPLPPETAVVVLDTATRRGLAESAYNERRRQCHAAAECLGVPALRDADAAHLERLSKTLDATTYRRARHVICENTRTLDAVDAMRRGDAVALGALMNQSHASLRDDYEVSCPELDAMADCACRHPACFGARMTGAGFGGCAVALIGAASADRFTAETAAAYHRTTGLTPALYVSQPSAGTHTVPKG